MPSVRTAVACIAYEIAQQIGYNNINSYIRFYHKYEGMMPGEYRKLNEPSSLVDVARHE